MPIAFLTRLPFHKAITAGGQRATGVAVAAGGVEDEVSPSCTSPFTSWFLNWFVMQVNRRLKVGLPLLHRSKL